MSKSSDIHCERIGASDNTVDDVILLAKAIQDLATLLESLEQRIRSNESKISSLIQHRLPMD